MIGQRMNGGTIVAATPAVHNEYWVVLHISDSDSRTHDPYATGLVHYTQLPKPEEWWSGHYFHRLEDAVRDYQKRATDDATHIAGQIVMSHENLKQEVPS